MVRAAHGGAAGRSRRLDRSPGRPTTPSACTSATAGRAPAAYGNGAGFDVYPLRTSAAPASPPALHAREARQDATRSRRPRTTASMEGRPLALDAHRCASTPRSRDFAAGGSEIPKSRARCGSRSRLQTKATQWGMAIDLNACTGCNACVDRLPGREQRPGRSASEQVRARPRDALAPHRPLLLGRRPETSRRSSFQPVPCQHCENAPCEQVCPVGGDRAQPPRA